MPFLVISIDYGPKYRIMEKKEEAIEYLVDEWSCSQQCDGLDDIGLNMLLPYFKKMIDNGFVYEITCNGIGKGIILGYIELEYGQSFYYDVDMIIESAKLLPEFDYDNNKFIE